MMRKLARVIVRSVNILEPDIVIYNIFDCDGNEFEIRSKPNAGLDEAFEKGLCFQYPLGVDIPLYKVNNAKI